jgi:ssDNA-binding Zn-finger/Zn-ribbon topoisomerase 1
VTNNETSKELVVLNNSSELEENDKNNKNKEDKEKISKLKSKDVEIVKCKKCNHPLIYIKFNGKYICTNCNLSYNFN